jgi:NAD+ diphosphatase
MPHHPPHTYAGAYVDRDSGLRRDTAALEALRLAPLARFIVVSGLRHLIRAGADPRAALLTMSDLDEPPSETIFLGHFRGHPVFVVEQDADTLTSRVRDTDYADLRAVGGLLPRDEAGLLAYARALVYWRARHRYCGSCGARTVPRDAGHAMSCPDCGAQAFPRIDPAIIVLVSDGSRALLGRQASWPAGRYSTIAGFVEPGESLEDAVAREVREETAIEVHGVRYHSSQPWPFPSSLMLGFEAAAATDRISCPDGELEDARWFEPEDLAAGRVLLPPETSISFRLIRDWYARVTGGVTLAAGQPWTRPRDSH